MSIYVPSDLEGTGKAKPRADTMIALVRRMITTWPDKFDLVTSTREVKQKRGSGKILLAMGMENGSPIEGDLKNVEYFYRLGIRYITLAHAKWNHLADGSYDSTRHWNGLSPFGVKVVKEMNRVGMMVDISHLTDSAAFQVLRTSGAPVIASHSACRFFTPGFERNMNDALIRALAAKRGVVQINCGSDFLDNRVRLSSETGRKAIDKQIGDNQWDPDGNEATAYERQYWKEHPRPYATVAQVAAHIDHVAQLVGVEYVGIGSDFDGVGDSLPIGLKDVSCYPNLIAELLKLGYGETDIEKICGGNLMRVWSEVEQVATSSK
jgi:membrane dipeptidase